MGKRKTIRNYNEQGELISKECSKCHKIKPVSEFNKSKTRGDGIEVKCRECCKKYKKDYYEQNREKELERKRQYYENNKDKKKEHYENNKDKIKEQRKQYRQENKDKINEYNKQYREENRDKINEYSKQYYKEHRDQIKNNYDQNKNNVKDKRKEYYEQNKDYIKHKRKEYYEQNIEKEKDKRKERYNKQLNQSLNEIKDYVEKDPEEYKYNPNEEIYGIIYLVSNLKSKRNYIGQTTIGLDLRYPLGWLYEHCKKDSVKEDLELYGEKSFGEIQIIAVAHNQYDLDKLEAYYIDKYDSYENGYNRNRSNIFTNRGLTND